MAEEKKNIEEQIDETVAEMKKKIEEISQNADKVEGDLAVSEQEIQCASLLLAVLVLTDLHAVFIYDSGAAVSICLDAKWIVFGNGAH